MRSSLLTLLLLLLCWKINAQCAIGKIDFDSKVENAALIIEGKVVDKYCFFNLSETFIYTKHRIEVYKLFKGTTVVDTVTVITEGGMLEGKMINVNPSVKLNTGAVGIFILNPCAFNLPDSLLSNAYSFYGGIQGFIKYDQKKHSATVPFYNYSDIQKELYDAITNKLAAPFKVISELKLDTILPYIHQRTVPAINNFSPSSITAGTGSVLTINGSDFGSTRGVSTVGFSNADDGGSSYIFPKEHQYVSWSDTQINVIVPSDAGTGFIQINTDNSVESVTPLIVSYAQLNVDYNDSAFATRLVTLNDQEGISWRMSRNFYANTAAQETFVRAIESWACHSFINWKVGPVIDVDVVENDGINAVVFEPLSEGTLAACYSYWNLCDSVWVVAELDMGVSTLYYWQFGLEYPNVNQFDFESVVLHELGHGHQLGHVIDSLDIMHYSVAPGAYNRAIGANNNACANDIMHRSTMNEFCSFYPIMTPLNSTNCSEIFAKNSSNEFKVFPNPSAGFFNIAIPNKKQNLSIDCYNSYGALVKSITATNAISFVPIDISDLAQGMYLLVINNGEVVVTERVIVAFVK